MNIRKSKILRRRSWLGSALRLPFKLIPQSMVCYILFGALRGKRWIKGSHNISILFGAYERFQTREFCKQAKACDVFWDLGAHVGYYSLLYNAVNPSGQLYGFEPVEGNALNFRRHMSLNNVENYQLFVSAVSDKKGISSFNTRRTSVSGNLSDNGNMRVETIKLSDLVADGSIKIPGLIKMDIEGAEIVVLRDIVDLLKSHHPRLFLSTHGKSVHDDCLSLLNDLEYKLYPLDSPSLSNCRELLAL